MDVRITCRKREDAVAVTGDRRISKLEGRGPNPAICPEQFQEEAPNQVSHLLDVLDQCSQAPSKSSSEYLENVTIVLPSEVHGLQSFLMPCKARRMQHTQEVLTVQEQIQGRLSCDMRAQVLSARSMRSSRPTRVLARLLGEGHASSLTEEQFFHTSNI